MDWNVLFTVLGGGVVVELLRFLITRRSTKHKAILDARRDDREEDAQEVDFALKLDERIAFHTKEMREEIAENKREIGILKASELNWRDRYYQQVDINQAQRQERVTEYATLQLQYATLQREHTEIVRNLNQLVAWLRIKEIEIPFDFTVPKGA